jgi:hypothetical protein
MTKNHIKLGFTLFIVTMIIFFIVYYFFGGTNYFIISLSVNAFVLPVIYCAFAFVSVRSFWLKHNGINFKEAFKRAFVPMFIGGFLSVVSIFIFLNFVDTEAKNLLNHQYIERQKTELNNEYSKARSILKNEVDKQDLDKKYQERLKSFAPNEIQGKDMLTASHFSGYFAAILIFYLILALFFGAFFRGRRAK